MDYAKLDGENIIITIPVSDLSGAAYQGLDAVGCEYDDGMNYNDLARDIVSEINSESENGTTLVNVMLDAAVIEASEKGADAFAYLDHPTTADALIDATPTE